MTAYSVSDKGLSRKIAKISSTRWPPRNLTKSDAVKSAAPWVCR